MTKFNDYITLNDRDYAIMKQKYDQILENETSDLREILLKMTNQRDELSRQNADSRYDEIISKLQNNIDELSTIIDNNHSNILYKHKSAEIPHIKGLFGHSVGKLQNENDGAISPIRSEREMERHNAINQTPSQVPNNNINNGTSNLSPSPNQDDFGRRPSPAIRNDDDDISLRESRPNTLKRRSPMPSNPISNFIKQFNLNWKNPKKQAMSTLDTHRNRFHNIIVQHHRCDGRNLLVTSQIDIIRLLLLYLALRPNCKYLSRIATITNDQFESLLQLENF